MFWVGMESLYTNTLKRLKATNSVNIKDIFLVLNDETKDEKQVEDLVDDMFNDVVNDPLMLHFDVGMSMSDDEEDEKLLPPLFGIFLL